MTHAHVFCAKWNDSVSSRKYSQFVFDRNVCNFVLKGFWGFNFKIKLPLMKNLLTLLKPSHGRNISLAPYLRCFNTRCFNTRPCNWFLASILSVLFNSFQFNSEICTIFANAMCLRKQHHAVDHKIITTQHNTTRHEIRKPLKTTPHSRKHRIIIENTTPCKIKRRHSARHGTAWHGTARHGTERNGTERHNNNIVHHITSHAHDAKVSICDSCADCFCWKSICILTDGKIYDV